MNTGSKFNVNIILHDFYLGKKKVSVFCISGKIAVGNCTFPVCDWCECLSVAKQEVQSIMITVSELQYFMLSTQSQNLFF